MALIKCPECGKENVSDSAPTCPECGFAIREHFDNIKNAKIAQEQEVEKKKQAKQKKQREIENKKQQEQRRLASVTMPEKPKLATGKLFGVIGLWALVILLSLTPPGNADSTSPESFIIKLCLMALLPIMATVTFYKHWSKSVSDYELAMKNFDEYKKQVLKEEDIETLNEQSRLKKLENAPKCPSCQSTNVKSISTTSRVVSVGMVGLASSKIGKTMECKNCGYKW